MTLNAAQVNNAVPEAKQRGASVVFDSNHDGSGEGKKKKTVTKSSYRDFSRDRPPKTEKGRKHKEPAHTFPMKLHAILSNPEFQDIIAWLPHGRAWRILQHKAFEERVIPLFFRHGRYSSFARQVNGWGFRRITHGPDYNAYCELLYGVRVSVAFIFDCPNLILTRPSLLFPFRPRNVPSWTSSPLCQDEALDRQGYEQGQQSEQQEGRRSNS